MKEETKDEGLQSTPAFAKLPVMCCKDYFIQKLNKVNTAITNGTFTGSYWVQVRIKEKIENTIKFIGELEAL